MKTTVSVDTNGAGPAMTDIIHDRRSSGSNGKGKKAK